MEAAAAFPAFKTWGNRRMLRYANGNGKGEVVGDGDGGAGRRFSKALAEVRIGGRTREGGDGGDGGGDVLGKDDAQLEEVREKLLLHLREAADRMKLVTLSAPSSSPSPSKGASAETERAADRVADAEPSSPPAARPWNLRTRRSAGSRAPTGVDRWVSGSSPEKRTVRLRSEDVERRERPKFSITLTRDEIDEDIYAVTGCRARRRPRKRPRVVQKQLDSIFPGSWLSEITVDSYRVPE